MITFIHGDDTVSSRNLLLKIKQDTKADTFYADLQDAHVLLQLIQGNNLFNDKKTIVIENIFAKKSLANLELLESRIKTLKTLDLYIWEGKELNKSQLSSFGKTETKLFKIPQKVFYFLDGIAPKNNKNITMFHDALQSADEEFLFFMLIRQMRLLINITGNKSEIDEVRRLALWQKSKLESQAKKFGSEKLINCYKKLFEIESKLKVGKLNMSLVAAIDIFLSEI